MITAAIVLTRTGSLSLVYLVWMSLAIGIVLIGPWPRPVTRFRRAVSALVVAVVLAGALMTTAKHAAIVGNPCEMWGGGWLQWLCEVMP